MHAWWTPRPQGLLPAKDGPRRGCQHGRAERHVALICGRHPEQRHPQDQVGVRSRNGMTIDDNGVAPGDLGDEEEALLATMDKVKGKGGAMFALAQQQDNPEDLEFTGLYFRSVAERLAVQQAGAVKTSEANAALHRVAATTRAGGHGRTRVAWKAVYAEKVEGHTQEMAAKDAQIRELQAQIAASTSHVTP